jgi:hypothetical protein
MSLSGRSDDSAGTIAPQLEAFIESWTGERPHPERWIETSAFVRARSALCDALSAGPGAILVTGPSGHGKTTLLRSCWHHPPRGLAPILVPSGDIPSDQIAARILSTARGGAVHDAAGALSRLLRAQTLRGSRPVLLLDDLEKMPPETLSALVAIAEGSRIEFGLVAAGSTGEALNALVGLLARPIRTIAIDEPWTRADAECLIARIGDALEIAAGDLIAGVDVDEALRGSDGNPRLVRAAIAAQLRLLDLLRPKIGPVMPPPEAAFHSKPTVSSPLASFEPAFPPAPAAPEPVSPAVPVPPPVAAAAAPDPPAQSVPPQTAPVPTGSDAPARQFPGDPPLQRSVSRSGRSWPYRRPSRRVVVAASGALAASVALVVLVDRGPPIAAWLAATARSAVSGTARWIAKIELPDLRSAGRDWLAQLTPTPVAESPIRVAVNSDPWSNVEVDGVDVGPTPLVVELTPGSHRFRAELSNGLVREQQLDVAEDRNRVVLH